MRKRLNSSRQRVEYDFKSHNLMSKPILFLLHQNLVNSVSIIPPTPPPTTHTHTLSLPLGSGAAGRIQTCLKHMEPCPSSDRCVTAPHSHLHSGHSGNACSLELSHAFSCTDCQQRKQRPSQSLRRLLLHSLRHWLQVLT